MESSSEDLPLRRADRAIPKADARRILEDGVCGVLAMVSPDGSPYAVPMNYALADDTLILHSAKEGRKLECIRHEPRVTFCVVGKSEVVPEKLTMRYECVLVSGVAEIVESGEGNEKRRNTALKKLADRHAPNSSETADHMITQYREHTRVILVQIHSICGKCNP
jgi:Predicted flavin-nucleotide-binding protein